MFTKEKNDTGFVFKFKKEQKNSLHMLFVFYPIDVIFIAGDGCVVDMKHNFLPFTFYNPKYKSKIVIELPNNTIKKSKIQLGDKITIVQNDS